MNLKKEQIAAMAIAAIAEETKEDIKNLKIISFREIQKSKLEQYLKEHQIVFRKYQLGEEIE